MWMGWKGSLCSADNCNWQRGVEEPKEAPIVTAAKDLSEVQDLKPDPIDPLNDTP